MGRKAALVGLLGGQLLLVEAVLQDRLDRAVGVGAKRKGTGRGFLEALSPIAVGEADDAEAAAKALLGMAPPCHHLSDELGSRRSGLLREGHDA